MFDCYRYLAPILEDFRKVTARASAIALVRLAAAVVYRNYSKSPFGELQFCEPINPLLYPVLQLGNEPSTTFIGYPEYIHMIWGQTSHEDNTGKSYHVEIGTKVW